MPIRAYKCNDCGTVVERLEKIDGSVIGDSDAVHNTHCVCGGVLARTLTAPSVFILKGSGFYKRSREQ